MTVIEQRTCEAICWLATTLQKEVPKVDVRLECLPRIASALESIAESLETLRCNAAPKDPRDYSGMGPESDDV